MGLVYRFPSKLALRDVRLAQRRRHDVWVRVVDRLAPEATQVGAAIRHAAGRVLRVPEGF